VLFTGLGGGGHANSSVIIINIMQATIRTTSSFDTVPINIRIPAAGTNKTFTVFNNLEQLIFIIKGIVKPSTVIPDPEEWI